MSIENLLLINLVILMGKTCNKDTFHVCVVRRDEKDL